MKSMATLKEIAEKAGVSIGTVDRVLHNRGRVSKENIEKIMRIVDESGYVPNQLASRLKTQKVTSFGVLIPSLESEYGYWSQIGLGINEAKEELKSLEVAVVYSFYDRNDPESFVRAAEELFTQDIKAYITAPLLPEEMRTVYKRHPDVPFVFLDSSLPGIKATWDFSQDPVKAGQVAARLMYLLDPSINEVCAIQSFKSAFNGEMRGRSFLDAFSKLSPGAVVRNCYVSEGEAVKEELASLFSAAGNAGFFVVNDSVHQVCEVLDGMGLSGRFRIIGFDLSPENFSCLEEGKVDVILGQAPRDQGYEAVMLLYRQYVLGVGDHGDYKASVDIYLKENARQSVYWG